MDQINIWCFPKSGAATPPWRRCGGLEEQIKITWGPILPCASLSALTDGSTENQQNEEEIGPALWKSKSHLSSVITVLPSSLQSRTRASLSYTSTAKLSSLPGHCHMAGGTMPLSNGDVYLQVSCPARGKVSAGSRDSGPLELPSETALLAVHSLFKSRIMQSSVNMRPWAYVSP